MNTALLTISDDLPRISVSELKHERNLRTKCAGSPRIIHKDENRNDIVGIALSYEFEDHLGGLSGDCSVKSCDMVEWKSENPLHYGRITLNDKEILAVKNLNSDTQCFVIRNRAISEILERASKFDSRLKYTSLIPEAEKMGKEDVQMVPHPAETSTISVEPEVQAGFENDAVSEPVMIWDFGDLEKSFSYIVESVDESEVAGKNILLRRGVFGYEVTTTPNPENQIFQSFEYSEDEFSGIFASAVKDAILKMPLGNYCIKIDRNGNSPLFLSRKTLSEFELQKLTEEAPWHTKIPGLDKIENQSVDYLKSCKNLVLSLKERGVVRGYDFRNEIPIYIALPPQTWVLFKNEKDIVKRHIANNVWPRSNLYRQVKKISQEIVKNTVHVLYSDFNCEQIISIIIPPEPNDKIQQILSGADMAGFIKESTDPAAPPVYHGELKDFAYKLINDIKPAASEVITAHGGIMKSYYWDDFIYYEISGKLYPAYLAASKNYKDMHIAYLKLRDWPDIREKLINNSPEVRNTLYVIANPGNSNHTTFKDGIRSMIFSRHEHNIPRRVLDETNVKLEMDTVKDEEIKKLLYLQIQKRSSKSLRTSITRAFKCTKKTTAKNNDRSSTKKENTRILRYAFCDDLELIRQIRSMLRIQMEEVFLAKKPESPESHIELNIQELERDDDMDSILHELKQKFTLFGQGPQVFEIYNPRTYKTTLVTDNIGLVMDAVVMLARKHNIEMPITHAYLSTRQELIIG